MTDLLIMVGGLGLMMLVSCGLAAARMYIADRRRR